MATKLDTTTATTLEGQALQIAFKMNELEKANVDAGGNQRTDNIQIAPNTETGAFVVTLTFQTDSVIAPDGVTITPQGYLFDTKELADAAEAAAAAA